MYLLSPTATVSFDPNIRAEWLNLADIRRQWRPVLERANYILPSAGEAMLLTGARDDEKGCRQLAAAGKVVVLKRGASGCTVFSPDGEFEIAGFNVEEVDPTGAGDTFCAGFTVRDHGWNEPERCGSLCERGGRVGGHQERADGGRADT